MLIYFRLSLEELIQAFFDGATRVLEMKPPVDEKDEFRQRVLRYLPEIIRGIGEMEVIEERLLTSDIENLLIVAVVGFFVALAGVVVVFSVFVLPIYKQLSDEHEKSVRMLKLIPVASLKENFAAQVLLRGKPAAREAMMDRVEKGLGMKLTEDGLPVPIESMVNLELVRDVLAKSAENLAKRIQKIFGRGKKEEDEKHDKKQTRSAKRKAELEAKEAADKLKVNDATFRIPIVDVTAPMNDSPVTPGTPASETAGSRNLAGLSQQVKDSMILGQVRYGGIDTPSMSAAGTPSVQEEKVRDSYFA